MHNTHIFEMLMPRGAQLTILAVRCADTGLRPAKALARLGEDPGLAPVIGREVARIRALRDQRRQRRWFVDPLVAARQSRPYRRPSAIREQASRLVRARAEAKAEVERLVADFAQREAVRRSLIDAAAIARRLGLRVRSSKDRAGHVSSYYCTTSDGIRFRISNHEIPWTEEREFMAAERGGYFGYPGPQLILTRPRRAEWLRRAITLLAAGRSVP
jgi:hypothetical protein